MQRHDRRAYELQYHAVAVPEGSPEHVRELVNVLDPQTQVDTTVVPAFYQSITMLLFLQMDVHYWLLRAVVNSYAYISTGSLHLGGAFTLLTPKGREQVGYMENQGYPRLLTDREEVRVLVARYGIIRAQALNPYESLDLIEKMLEER